MGIGSSSAEPRQPLERRRFGRTGWEVPVLGLGTYCLTTDWGVHHDDAVAIVRRAVALGVDVIDTAPLYGSGEAEVIVREGLAGMRHRHRLIEKVGRFDQSIFRRRAEAAYEDPRLIRAQFEHSLRLLGRESVDALLIHEADWSRWWRDSDSATGGVMEALRDLRREGRVERLGISTRDVGATLRLCATGAFDILLFVHFFNVVWQEAGDAIVAATARQAMGLAIGAPLRRGLLARVDAAVAAALRAERRPDVPPGAVERLLRAGAIAADAGISLAELSLRYLLSFDGVHMVFVGPETVDQLEQNVASAARGPLPADVLAAIRELRAIELGEWRD